MYQNLMVVERMDGPSRLGAHEYRVEVADDGPRPPRKHNHHSFDDYAYWTRAAS
eukprot:gene1198-870_t